MSSSSTNLPECLTSTSSFITGLESRIEYPKSSNYHQHNLISLLLPPSPLLLSSSTHPFAHLPLALSYFFTTLPYYETWSFNGDRRQQTKKYRNTLTRELSVIPHIILCTFLTAREQKQHAHELQFQRGLRGLQRCSFSVKLCISSVVGKL